MTLFPAQMSFKDHHGPLFIGLTDILNLEFPSCKTYKMLSSEFTLYTLYVKSHFTETRKPLFMVYQSMGLILSPQSVSRNI